MSDMGDKKDRFSIISFVIIVCSVIISGCLEGIEEDNNQDDTNENDNHPTDTNQTDTNQTDTNQTDTNQTDTNQTDTNQTGNNKTSLYPYVKTSSGPYVNNIEYHRFLLENYSVVANRLADTFNLTIVSNDTSSKDQIFDYHYYSQDGFKITLKYISGSLNYAQVSRYSNSRDCDEDLMDNHTLDNLSINFVKKFDINTSNYIVKCFPRESAGQSTYSHTYGPKFQLNDNESCGIYDYGISYSHYADNGDFVYASFNPMIVNFSKIRPYFSIEEANNISQQITNRTENFRFEGIGIYQNHICYQLELDIRVEQWESDIYTVYIDIQSGDALLYNLQRAYWG
ncbi:MAG: hypothetical protein QF682_11430 [Candidatus Thermoplasmatota archaeon]|nr:hypothetical protein [Candidatus Thermoplasmatota archaeon]